MPGAVGSSHLTTMRRLGYTQIWQGYTVVKTCTPDDPIEARVYTLICNSYTYPYHYGDAVLLEGSFYYEGKDVAMYYLCLDGHEECESIQDVR